MVPQVTPTYKYAYHLVTTLLFWHPGALLIIRDRALVVKIMRHPSWGFYDDNTSDRVGQGNIRVTVSPQAQTILRLPVLQMDLDLGRHTFIRELRLGLKIKVSDRPKSWMSRITQSMLVNVSSRWLRITMKDRPQLDRGLVDSNDSNMRFRFFKTSTSSPKTLLKFRSEDWTWNLENHRNHKSIPIDVIIDSLWNHNG